MKTNFVQLGFIFSNVLLREFGSFVVSTMLKRGEKCCKVESTRRSDELLRINKELEAEKKYENVCTISPDGISFAGSRK